MKKTIIALMAMTGLAMADTTTATLGSWYEKNGVKYVTVDAVNGLTETEADLLLPSDKISEAKGNTTFEIYTDELLLSGTRVGDTVRITSLQISSGCLNTHYIGEHASRTASVTLGNVTYTSNPQSAAVTSGQYGILTYNFSGDNAFSFVVGDTLKVSINAVDGVAHTQYGTFKGQEGISDLEYSTVSGWQTSVKLNGTVIASVPEPTTTTLSLLALAGLAARRRRK